MTVHAVPSSTSEPALALRLNKPPRVPFWYWLFHPRRAKWITMLIRESFRWRAVPNTEPNALTWAEKALFERAQQAQEKAVANVAKRLDKLADRYQALLAVARRERTLARLQRQRRLIPKTEVHIYAAGAITLKRAKKIIAQCRERITKDTEEGQTRHQERPSKARDWMSAAPLLVDIVALMTVIAKFLNVTPGNALQKFPETATTIGFSLIAALVLALLAHSAGDAAWHLRATGDRTPSTGKEFPKPRPVLYAKLISLAMVSALAACSIALRVIHPTADYSTGPLGVMIGTLIGLAAFLAPWVIVLNRMRSGSLEVRTVDALTEMVREVEDAVTRHEKSAVLADQRATKLRQSADSARSGELQSAMDRTAATRQVIELARSYHGQAGRLAIDNNAVVADPYVSMQSVLATDTSVIDEAMKRFEPPDDEPDDDPAAQED
jgi:hypothetical protein